MDLYDKIAGAMENNDKDKAEELAAVYWQKIVRLDQYNHNHGFRRREVMATYDVPSTMIEPI